MTKSWFPSLPYISLEEASMTPVLTSDMKEKTSGELRERFSALVRKDVRRKDPLSSLNTLVVSWEEACLLFLEERKTSNRNWHD
jgi:hypothetical protein